MKQKSTHEKQLFPKIVLNRRNLLVFIIGFVIIAVGYFLLSVPPWDNPISRSVAPLVLLFGYLIAIPYAIFAGGSKEIINGKKQKSE